MAKTINYDDRKKLIEGKRKGLSNSKLKNEFHIKDDRTLNRHLKLAEQEEEAKIIKLEILKDKIVSHLDEVNNLIGEWKSSLSTPGIRSIYYDMPNIPTHDIEVNPLFSSLKEHLPFPVLWRDYGSWKNNIKAYIEGCQLKMKEIGEMGKGSIPENIYKLWGTESTAKAMRLVEPLYQLMRKYEEAVNNDGGLKIQKENLQKLENKLHISLQGIQYRHDHITYSCKLCPGQPRLSR